MITLEKYNKLAEENEYITKTTFDVGGRKFHSFNYSSLFDKDFYQKDGYYQECRGLTFDDEDGDLIIRPFKKFYNLNENPKSYENCFDWDRVLAVTEKKDGCMINPIIIKSQIYFKTKSSVSDEAKICQEWYEKHPKREELRKAILKICRKFYTPIFEFVSPGKHVLECKEPQLYFICMRGLFLGDIIFSRQNPLIENMVNVLGCDIELKFKDLKGEELLNSIKQYQKENETEEGVVVYFNDGKMVKCKTDWYFKLHKIFGIEYDKRYFDYYFENKIDDVRSLCNTNKLYERIKKIDDIEEFIKFYLSNMENKIIETLDYVKDEIDRKSYYMKVKNLLKDEDFSDILVSICMMFFNKSGVCIKETLIKMITFNKKNVDKIYKAYSQH